MMLPDLDWQFHYGRVAWAVVLTATALAALRSWRLPVPSAALLFTLAAGAQFLPGGWSPAYWLGLAFQSPSTLTVAVCTASIRAGRRRKSGACMAAPGLLSLHFHCILAAAGGVLYVDAMGLTSFGLYYLGFDPTAAPLSATVIAGICAAALWRGRQVLLPMLVLLALLPFMLLRLPTGNLWDAVIDPLLWTWSVFHVAGALCRRRPRPALARGKAAGISGEVRS